MRIKEAVAVLKAHNEWRREDTDIPVDRLPMGSPSEIGAAIDVIVEYAERHQCEFICTNCALRKDADVESKF